MSMRFESITIRNFGPYRRIDSLNLATTARAPVVLIHGENTMGKTRLFRALRWCLYGSPTFEETAAHAIQASRNI